MCVMNFLKGKNYSNSYLNACDKIVSYLKCSNKNKPNEYFSIYECIINTKLEEHDIYQAIHILLIHDIIKKYYFAICPECDTENDMLDLNMIKCDLCRTTFYPDHTIERFKFIDNELEKQQK